MHNPQVTTVGYGVCRTCGGKKMVVVKMPNGNLRQAPCPTCKGQGVGLNVK